jgi:putative membrane protein
VSFPKKLLLSWALDALALGAAAWLFRGVSGSLFSIVLAALVFGLLSTFLKPILRVVTFVLALVTLGIAWFGVAMFILWLTSWLVHGFHIHGFWTLVGATVVVWAVSAAGHLALFHKWDK